MSELNDRAYTYYRYFLAMKLHFKDKKFNFFSHDGKTRVSVQTYNGRRDRYFFERSASIYNTQKFLDKCLTEIKKNPNFFIKDLLTPDNESRYLRRKGFLESFKNSFDKEVSEITNHCLKNRINSKDRHARSVLSNIPNLSRTIVPAYTSRIADRNPILLSNSHTLHISGRSRLPRCARQHKLIEHLAQPLPLPRKP